MSNTHDRNKKEIESLLKDPKYSRKAWKAIGLAIASNPVQIPTERQYDKDGNETLSSVIEHYSYDRLRKDLDTLGDGRTQPTELEMILQCQIVKARYDTAAATFVRDTLGAKPVDETKLDAAVHNPYEEMSDEELEMLAEFRRQKALEMEQREGIGYVEVPVATGQTDTLVEEETDAT